MNEILLVDMELLKGVCRSPYPVQWLLLEILLSETGFEEFSLMQFL